MLTGLFILAVAVANTLGGRGGFPEHKYSVAVAEGLFGAVTGLLLAQCLSVNG